tara:strand:- start:2088 stop:2678 length:591 start_codon:yes stop_codon:yes gene_type:complete
MSEQNETLSNCREFIESSGIDTSDGGWKTKLPAPPLLPFDADKSYYWDVETNKGSLKIKLWPHIAPQHVSSTIYLTTLGFYDDLSFHRVIKGFMAQGGCPEGRGTGGPGFQYDGELSPEARHDRPGLLSMANSGPGTDGSQFFLTFVATPWLDGNHTLFGEVVEGKETLTELEVAGSESGDISEPLGMTTCSISIE